MKVGFISAATPSISWFKGTETVMSSSRISMRLNTVKKEEYEAVMELRVSVPAGVYV